MTPWRNSVAFLIAFTALAGAASCKRKPPCRGELTSDDLFHIQELVQAGEDACPALARPELDLAIDTGLRLDGRPLVPFASLPTEAGFKVQPLFAELRASREVWKQVHPAQEFAPEVRLRASPNLEAGTVASVLKTAAFAGYPTTQVESGGVSLRLDWNVPGPPGDFTPTTLRIAQTQRGAYVTQFDGPARLPERTHEFPGVDAIPEWVNAQCATLSQRCVDAVIVEARGPFVGVLTLVRDVLRTPALARRPPRVELVAGS